MLDFAIVAASSGQPKTAVVASHCLLRMQYTPCSLCHQNSNPYHLCACYHMPLVIAGETAR